MTTYILLIYDHDGFHISRSMNENTIDDYVLALWPLDWCEIRTYNNLTYICIDIKLIMCTYIVYLNAWI